MTVPFGSEDVEILGAVGAAATVSRNCLEAVRLFASVTWTVKSNGPALVDVPVMPPFEFNASPGGNVPPVAANV